ncbi:MULTISPECIES: glycosyltransferase family 2 protein [Cryobacterium]|uniref:glycosyltransferase n=1 Tax=Cryobacterium TaxID=69578 RepID=UPI001F53F84C|nr:MULTISPECIES: glycosyltransferase family 2 protein [Cryobacterium]
MTDNTPRTSHAVTANRWDILGGLWPKPLPVVSVVIAHFEQQSQLDRTLLALERQTYPNDFLDMIVVDDGSRAAPSVPAKVRLIRQEDRGFRLAAARNAGARAARGSILCFLDADTTPEPDYVRELTRLPSLAADAVTVGMRRHADLSATSADGRIELIAPNHELPAPAWLTREYERSSDLLEVDHRSYRFLIGAVLACSRDFFAETGGFDESFTEYGGEDWEWGYRAWLAGAVFAHVRNAVAWHDGPEWSERTDADASRQRRKNAETLKLTQFIPARGSAGRGVRPPTADLLVEIQSSTSSAALFICVDSVLESLPHAVVVVPGNCLDSHFNDPRVVRRADAGERPLVRATVAFPRAVRVDPEVFRREVERVASGSGDAADVVVRDSSGSILCEIRSVRARRRSARWQRDGLFPTVEVVADWVIALDQEPDLEAYLGGWS